MFSLSPSLVASNHRLSKLLAVILCLLLVPSALADVRLPRLLSDGAILQRDKPLVIWGWAESGETVRVNFADQELSTKAEAGRWSVTFPAHQAGGPYRLQVNGNNQLVVKDIWLGDLWIAAGQSNMELPLRRVQYRYPDVLTQTQLPQIREFSVPVAYRFDARAEDYTQGQWKTAVPENLGGFSAVGFFFARQLHQSLDVPIGILSIAVGGSPVEAWMSESALEDYPHYLALANKFKDSKVLQDTIASDKAKSDAWYSKAQANDFGLKASPPWSTTKIDESDWRSYQVPGFFKEQNIDFINGVVWLRKSIELTAAQAKQPAQLWLGVLVDGDQVFVNGVAVGQTGYRYPPRIYDVPENILTAGNNNISVRLTSYSSEPGFIKDKLYALKLGQQEINLAGEWHYRIGMRAEQPMPSSTTLHYQPSTLFKAKLAPALGFAMKGVIWFQGESNVGRGEEYKTLFPDMITDWRSQFNQGEFPFLFVQLANFLEPVTTPGNSAWAELREAQRGALSVPQTAMAVAIDTGEWNDIHPLDKQTVGERLALAAHKLAYGQSKLVASGPKLHSVKRKGKYLVLSFDSLANGFDIRGDSLQEIAIAGDDKQFVWAKAKVKGKQIWLWNDTIKNPQWVRYAWADNPDKANLYNSVGLPASPFEAQVKHD